VRLKASDNNEVRVIIGMTKQLPRATPQVSNLIFRKVLRYLRLKPIGRQHFDPSRPIEVPQHRVQLWPGYFASINPTEMGIALVADVAHKVLRTDSVLDLINTTWESSNRNHRLFEENVKKQLVGFIVVTRYNNRTYRIDEIDWKRNPRSTFVKRTGEKISYVEYYRKTYDRAMITDLEQPLLLHRHRRRGAEDELIYLIPELCSMTGITDSMRQDFRVMQDLAAHTRVEPNQRKSQIDQFVTAINQNAQVKEILGQEWGLKVDPKAPTVRARILNAESLLFAKNAVAQVKPDTAEWMASPAVLTGVPLTKWLFIYNERNQRQAEDFLRLIQEVARSDGIRVDPPTQRVVQKEYADIFIAEAKRNIRPETQAVVFLMTSQRKEIYDSMKQLCCLEMPIPSQAVTCRAISNPKRAKSVCKNIIRQINTKCGGELWAIKNMPISKTMVIGIDVYHDTAPGGKRSVAGFIATTNERFTKCYSRVIYQSQQGQELVDKLRKCMVDALRHYFTINKYLPDRIIVYRDGVGDGMLAAVADHEVSQLREAFTQVNPDYAPRLAVVVVKKRIHTRIFGVGERSLRNPPPGTVVDTQLVHPEWYDFFLVSQSVKQGTVTPSHYHVITDNTGMNPYQMQMFTYKLCHLYFNWAGTIRVPAPCQYAHKIAFLVGQSLHRDPGTALADRLYFL
jgi:aubergine-like protein